MKRDELSQRLAGISKALDEIRTTLGALLVEVRPDQPSPPNEAPQLTAAVGINLPDPPNRGGFVTNGCMAVVTLEDGRTLHAIADGQGGCWCNGRLFMEPHAPEPTPEQLSHCAGWTRAVGVAVSAHAYGKAKP